MHSAQAFQGGIVEVIQTLKRLFLAGAVVALSLPGCQGEASSEPGGEELLNTSAQALCGSSVAPVMTGNTTPTGIVSRSGVFSSSYEAWQAFDSSFPTMWLSQENQTPAWLAYEWTDGPQVVHRYAIQYSNGSITTRAPKDWTFEGWNGSAWLVLDTRSNQINWGGAERREFQVTSPGSYRKYRLNISDDNDTRAGVVVISIGRLELLSCAPTTTSPLWTKTQGSNNGYSETRALAADGNGRTYAVGMSTVGIEGNAAVGTLDTFLSVSDASGVTQWSRVLGVPGVMTAGMGVAFNRVSNTVYVSGWADGALGGVPMPGPRNAFVTKYSAAGVYQWTRLVGVAGGSTYGYTVATDASDNSFIMGDVDAGLDGNVRAGMSDVFVTKFDAAGNKLWTRQTGLAGASTTGKGVVTDSAGNVYVSGTTNGALDGNSTATGWSVFVIKYDAAGVKQWTRQFYVSAGSGVTLLASTMDPAGNLYLSGYSNGDLPGNSVGGRTTAFLAQYTSAGVLQWVRQLGSNGGAYGNAVVANSSGVFLAGDAKGDVTVPSSTGTEQHSFLARFDAAGVLQWVSQQDTAFRNGSAVGVRCYGAAIDPNGNYYLAGSTMGNYGGNTLKGSTDTVLVKLSPQ
ncbi:SBBP repeat-containing protein [Corallococcus sp. M34]|uniref:SBBP repeat-containing protein n=1 Tax=Citreicoccus inhibens TaxID=2849499 RepID=UPI001C2342C1|nr:SBBP repeat-containing protein [Citreicoccus inhibens]MBU8899766.1 SBBP repeat-containing protein [Citreicoccus inhibens]